MSFLVKTQSLSINIAFLLNAKFVSVTDLSKSSIIYLSIATSFEAIPYIASVAEQSINTLEFGANSFKYFKLFVKYIDGMNNMI